MVKILGMDASMIPRVRIFMTAFMAKLLDKLVHTNTNTNTYIYIYMYTHVSCKIFFV